MRNLHVISHTHWDREWYLPFQSFRLKLVHLVDGLLDLLEKDPQFEHFMLDGQTIILDDYLAMRPEKEASLRKYIQEGRVIIGPWHILPDMFLVGPESHIRNLLQGDRTVRRFGPKMMIGYIPDPFGHPGQVPQILRGFGIETACLWRGLDDQPSEFWWQSPDGSRVLMNYLRDSYSNGADLPADQLEQFAGMLSKKADSLAAFSKTTERLIMYGTDHMEPPRNTSEAIAYADEMLPDTHVIHSSLPQYVASVQSQLEKGKIEIPTVTGELRACKRMHLLPGVLSTRMWIKQRNHASENLLTKWVEPFTTWQELVTGPQSSILNQKSSILNQVWRLLMENHPHDSICGCSIDQVHEEMKVRFDQVDQIGEELTRQSLGAISCAINTQSGSENLSSAIVIFNPTSSIRSDLVDITLESLPNSDGFDLLDGQGTSLPYQTHGLGSHELINMQLDPRGMRATFSSISDGHAMGMTIQSIRPRREGPNVFIEASMAEGGEPNLVAWEAGRKQVEEYLADPDITHYHVRVRSVPTNHIVFSAPPVPGLGYRVVWLRGRHGEEQASRQLAGPLVKALLPLARLPFFQKLAQRQHNARPPYQIENEFFLVTAEQDGTLALMDKRDGRRFTGLNRFVDGGDCGDEYNYAPPATDRPISPHLKHVSIASGPVQQTLKLELELPTPACLDPDRRSRSKETLATPISCLVTLSSGIPRVDIHTIIENSARDHRLRVHFPAPFATTTVSHDGHFEVVERKVGIPAFDATWVEQPRPEVPQRAFTDVSDGKSGLMLANRGLPEVEVLKNASGNAEIALTLLRCVGWLSRDDFSTRKGHAGPFLETPSAQMPGRWSFDYSIIPHPGNWPSAFWQAYAFETPLRAVTTDLHTGSLPPAGSFVETKPETFVVSAVKTSADGRGWLVRGYNITDQAIDVSIKPWKLFKKVELVNLAEQKQVDLQPDEAGCVIVPAGGHALVSVLFLV